MKVLVLFLFISLAITVSAQTTEFVYQGKLQDSAAPATGSYDFEFLLFDSLTNGVQVGPTVTRNGAAVTNGIFSVKLDFGAAFTGAIRFLEIHVRHSGGDPFTILTPRQEVSNTPYAVKALNAEYSAAAGNALSLAGVPASGYLPTAGGTISGNLTVSGVLTADGSGLMNVPGTFRWNVVAGTSQQAVANNGYIANNDSQVIITLPKEPNVGDTIRIAGAGAGGWLVAQNAGQRILTPLTDPANWTGNKQWQAVASSADGTKLVALADQVGIFTSTDSGATWTRRLSLFATWDSAASSADGSKLVAASLSGTYTSTDYGVTWTQRSQSLTSVASSDDGVKLVGARPFMQIYTSTDSGVTWTPHDSTRAWTSVASSSDGTKLVATVGGGQIYTSTDSGTSWMPRDAGRQWNAVVSSADGTKLVAAVSNGQLYTSIDSGLTWMPRDSNRNWSSVASSADGTKLVASVYNGQLYTSTDSGVTWTPRDPVRFWNSVASSAEGIKLVAARNVGAMYTSTDAGVTWKAPPPTGTSPGTSGDLTAQQSATVEIIYVGDGQFLVLSSGGTITVN